MRRLPVFALAGLLIAALTLVPAASAAASPQHDALAQLNQIRQASGLSQLHVSRSLHRSSTRYARHMIAADYFGHGSRIAASSAFGRVGETLELSSGWDVAPAETINAWMHSPGHRAVLLSRAYRWVGIGVARGRLGSRPVTVWVAHVGARR